MMKGEVEATMLTEPYITLTEKKDCRTTCSAFSTKHSTEPYARLCAGSNRCSFTKR